MIQVACPSCQASYDLDERRIPASGMRMRCPKCSVSFQVAQDGSAKLAPAAPPAPPAKAPPPPPAAGARPKLAPPVPGAADFDLDLPAAKVAAPKPGAAKTDDFDLDLPAAKVAAPKPGAAKTDDFDLDLPAPKGALATDHLDLPAVAKKHSLGGEFQIDLPGSRSVGGFDDELDLPAPKGLELDLPAPKAAARPSAGLGELDLPMAKPAARPSSAGFDELDLPMPKAAPSAGGGFGELDLPMPKAAPSAGFADLPMPKAAPSAGIADLPMPKAAPSAGIADLPMPKASGGMSFGDLDLPTPKAGVADLPAPKASGGGFALGDLDLPTPAVGVVDLPRPSSANLDLPTPKGASGGGGLELDLPSAAPSKAGSMGFGELDLGTPPPSKGHVVLPTLGGDVVMQSQHGLGDDLDELSLPSPRARTSGPSSGGAGFGEIDLAGGDDDGLEFGGLAHGGSDVPALDDVAPIVRDSMAGEQLTIEEKKALALAARKRRFRNVLGGTALALVVGASGGFALKFTKYGPFGQYAVEQLLPSAGSAASAAAAAQTAETRAKSDTYADVRASLTMLAGARRNEGLNRALLARSLMHESLYAVRFGDDASSTSRATGMAARLAERSDDAPGIELARAAYALRNHDVPGAASRIVRARAVAPNDPYVGIVAGEIALADEKPADAITAFRSALAHGGGARAQWGLARALVAAGDATADDAITATLTASPLHLEARTAKALRLLATDHLDEALPLAREAGGIDPVAGHRLVGASRSRAAALVVVGRIEELRSHRSEARFAYNAAADLDGTNLDALVGAGRVMLEENMAREAIVRFDSAIQQESEAVSMFATGEHPRTLVAEARLGAISALLAVERPNDALAHVQALAAMLPQDPEVAIAAGRVAHALHRDAEAEAAFRHVIELAPNRFDGYLQLSQLLFDLGRPDDAATALAGAEGKVQITAEVRRLEGEAELRRNQLAAARAKFQAALELDPQDRQSMFMLGVAFRRDGAYTDAASWFDRLAALDASFPGLALERGEIYEALGQADAAVRMFERALRERPDDIELQVRLGGAQVAAGDLEAANTTLGSVLERQPTLAPAVHYMGRLLLARGQLDDAVRRLADAVRLDGTRPEYHAWLATAYLEKSNLSQAQIEIDETLQRDPQSVDGHVLRARLLARSGRVDESLAEAATALQIDARRLDVWAVVAECEEQRGHRPEAIRDYQAALAGTPTRGDWWHRLARLQVDNGDQRAAIASYRRAIELGLDATPRPGYVAEALRGLGETAADIDDRATARDAFTRYLEIAPAGAPGRSEVQEMLGRL